MTRINPPALALLSVVTVLLLGQVFSHTFEYQRASILNGEYWRIVSGHFTHTQWSHLLLNGLGLALILKLFYPIYSPLYWSLGGSFCLIGIGLSFLLFSPELEWYRGLSGLLHGLLMMAMIGEISRGKRLYYLGLLALVGKVIAEQTTIEAGRLTEFIGATVIFDAHLYGVISGGLVALIFILTTKLE